MTHKNNYRLLFKLNQLAGFSYFLRILIETCKNFRSFLDTNASMWQQPREIQNFKED